MFFVIGLASGFAFFCGCLWLVDYIGYRRGLGGAHPLSPAMAYAALFGSIVMLGLVLAGAAIDSSAAQHLPSPIHSPERKDQSNGEDRS